MKPGESDRWAPDCRPLREGPTTPEPEGLYNVLWDTRWPELSGSHFSPPWNGVTIPPTWVGPHTGAGIFMRLPCVQPSHQPLSGLIATGDGGLTTPSCFLSFLSSLPRTPHLIVQGHP